MQQNKNTANRCWQHGLCCAVLCLSVVDAQSGELSGYATATTDYVRRGVSQSKSDPALQLGVDLNFDSGFYAGIWGSTMDMSSGPSRHRDTEVDYYVGYSNAVSSNWTIGVNAIRYTYPDMDGNVDYDYSEYMLVTNYNDRIWLEYAWSDGLYHTPFDTHNVELYTEQPIGDSWTIGAGAGYYDLSRLSGTGYGYWEFGLSRAVRRIELDLRYHDTNRTVPFFSSPDRADARLALSLQLSF